MAQRVKAGGVSLSKDDSARVAQIEEGLFKGLGEVQTILAKALGGRTGQGEAAHFEATFRRVRAGYLIRICSGGQCICYEDPPGICYPC